MSVRAKFFVAEVHQQAVNGLDVGKVILRPVSRGAANASWAAATPSGELSMFVSNPRAFTQLQGLLGRECYLDITPADAADPADGHAYVDPQMSEQNYGWNLCVECSQPEDAHTS